MDDVRRISGEAEARFFLYLPVRYDGHESVWRTFDSFAFFAGTHVLVTCFAQRSPRIPEDMDNRHTLARGRIDHEKPAWIFEEPSDGELCMELVHRLVSDDRHMLLRYFGTFHVVVTNSSRGTFKELALRLPGIRSAKGLPLEPGDSTASQDRRRV